MFENDPEWESFKNEIIVHKSDMIRFLQDWRENHSSLYALLLHLPLTLFHVEYADPENEEQEWLTLRELISEIGYYHLADDIFSIHFRTYLYRSEWDACCPGRKKYGDYFCGVEQMQYYSRMRFQAFPDYFELILAYHMRETMMDEGVFEVDEELCRKYGLTTEEIDAFRQDVEACREKLLDEFAGEAQRFQSIVKHYRS